MTGRRLSLTYLPRRLLCHFLVAPRWSRPIGEISGYGVELLSVRANGQAELAVANPKYAAEILKRNPLASESLESSFSPEGLLRT